MFNIFKKRETKTVKINHNEIDKLPYEYRKLSQLLSQYEFENNDNEYYEIEPEELKKLIEEEKRRQEELERKREQREREKRYGK